MKRPRALTIAGSDSGGGAGIQADLKTFAAHGVYGSSVITSITAQNTIGVSGTQDIDPGIISLQIEAVLTDIGADSIKTGMLSNPDIVRTVVSTLKPFQIKKLVVDPVMISKSGHSLLSPNAVKTVVDQLLPCAFVLTPNIPEAEALTGLKIVDLEGMKTAARLLASMGPRSVIVKGGHLRGEAVDVLYWKKEFLVLRTGRFNTKNTHGTGCTFSAAITSYLARGSDLPSAFRGAKRYITSAIKKSYSIGKGHSPVNHFHRFRA